jgi:hypothetical protein
MDLWSGSVGWGGFGPELRPSDTGYRRLADQHLPDAAPLGRQQEQRHAVRSAEHDGEDRAGVYKNNCFCKTDTGEFSRKITALKITVHDVKSGFPTGCATRGTFD